MNKKKYAFIERNNTSTECFRTTLPQMVRGVQRIEVNKKVPNGFIRFAITVELQLQKIWPNSLRQVGKRGALEPFEVTARPISSVNDIATRLPIAALTSHRIASESCINGCDYNYESTL